MFYPELSKKNTSKYLQIIKTELSNIIPSYSYNGSKYSLFSHEVIQKKHQAQLNLSEKQRIFHCRNELVSVMQGPSQVNWLIKYIILKQDQQTGIYEGKKVRKIDLDKKV